MEDVKDPAKRIQMLADELGVTVNKLWQMLGHKSSGTINSIIYGKTKSITLAFATEVCDKLPNVSYLFLTKGKLPVLIGNDINDLQQQLMGKEPKITLESISARLEVISKTQIKIIKSQEDILRTLEEMNKKSQ